MRHREAFTLAEVIVVCAILSVVVVMVTNLLPGAVLFLRSSEHRLEASRIAHRTLEGARAAPFKDLRLQPEVQSRVDSFTVERTVSPVPGTAPDKLAQVKVRVTWSEFQRNRSLEMLTYVSALAR